MSFRNSFGLDFHFSENEIYLDSATSGKLPVTSLETMNRYYTDLGGGLNRGTHKKALNANRILERSRSTIAHIFSIEPSNLSFLPSRETAITNFLSSGIFSSEDEVIVSSLDDHSVIAPLLKIKSLYKTNLNFVSLKEESNLAESIKNKISNKTKAIVLSSLTLGMGISRDWRELAKIAQDAEILFLLDISNEVGHKNFNFKEIMPDMVISSGNIGALGPQGTAFQILKEDMIKKFDPILVGGGSVISLTKDNFRLSSTISKYEPGTLNIAGISALANSLHSLSEIGFETISEHEKNLRRFLVNGLSETSKIDIIEHPKLNYGPILSFKSEEIDAHDIAIILEDLGNIYLRSGALCSHLFMEEVKQESLVQVSTHLYNTKEDIEIFLETLNSIMTEI
ncbi:MAG: aminotransferase class V-fold PLP-dependent enzyme [Candidatus Heimdallarchaeota archaeon]|nr:aminotransferase class V-fold PLP-dependent enzyme [Candidatus Heimdallarchaeota archaeon]